METDFERQLNELQTLFGGITSLHYRPAISPERYVTDKFAVLQIHNNLSTVIYNIIRQPLDQCGSITFYFSGYVVFTPLLK